MITSMKKFIDRSMVKVPRVIRILAVGAGVGILVDNWFTISGCTFHPTCLMECRLDLTHWGLNKTIPHFIYVLKFTFLKKYILINFEGPNWQEVTIDSSERAVERRQAITWTNGDYSVWWYMAAWVVNLALCELIWDCS